MKALSTPVPREKFDGPSSVVEPLLMDFQAQWGRARKLSDSTHHHCNALLEKVGGALVTAREAGSLVDYSGAEQAMERREAGLRVEEERVWSECERRERRWNLTLYLNQFEPDVEKVC